MHRSRVQRIKSISERTKQEVMDRQNGLSITGKWLRPYETDFHHVISKGREGVGFAFNVIALTRKEHIDFHSKCKIETENGWMSYLKFDIYMKDYLRGIYPEWREELCTYKDGWSEKDYWDAIGMEGKK